MQNAEDRRQLNERYGDGRAGSFVAVLKCAAGLLVLVAVAAGPWLLLSAEGGTTAAEPGASTTVRTFPNSMAESKRIFEERRQRHEARLRGTPGHDGVVAGAGAAENPAGK